MPETAFLGAQIAPKSLSAGDSPQFPLGELTALPRPSSWNQGALLLRLLLLRGREGRGGPWKIVHPAKFLRIGPATLQLMSTKTSYNDDVRKQQIKCAEVETDKNSKTG